MDTKKPAVDRILETLAPALAGEIERSVREALQDQQEQFSKQLTDAVRDAEAKAGRLSADLTRKLDERLHLAEASWAEERARLENELHLWRTCAEAQQTLAESASQTDMLRRFLKLVEPFAQSLAVYVMKADGLALWKRYGDAAFPAVVSQSTIDPESLFTPVVVRGKTVVAICAYPPLRREAIEFLALALERAIELFGVRLQSVALRPRAAQAGVAVRN
jgi:hypothetical protein